RPAPADPKVPTAWQLAIDLRAGALHCEGIDLVVDSADVRPRAEAEAEGRGRWGLFGVSAATELTLTRCTLTIEGDNLVSTGLGVGVREAESRREAEGAGAGVERPPARVSWRDSLLRTGGDLVEVVAGGQLALELQNVVVATGGSLIHAHGLPRGQVVAPV